MLPYLAALGRRRRGLGPGYDGCEPLVAISCPSNLAHQRDNLPQCCSLYLRGRRISRHWMLENDGVGAVARAGGGIFRLWLLLLIQRLGVLSFFITARLFRLLVLWRCATALSP